MVTLVHCADLHLETTFSGVRGGAKRRAALADALVRIVDLALERRADALCFGGDVYEAQRAGPQTARLLFAQIARFGKPVFIAPGNHDPYSATSLYARADRPPNLRVFEEAAWRAFPLAEDVTLYGFGHTPAEPGRPFRKAAFERAGARIALLHGSDEERCPPGKRATAPFTYDEVASSGASLLLTGHYHGGSIVKPERPLFAYPGSPEPIKFGERGEHGALVVKAHAGRIELESVPLARTRLIDEACELRDAQSEAAIITALEETLASYGANDYIRLRLRGTIAEATRVDPVLLCERFQSALGALEILDETVACDYDELAGEPTVRGHVIRDLLAIARGSELADAEVARTALRATVAAFSNSPIAPESAALK